jgi:TonB family protein
MDETTTSNRLALLVACTTLALAPGSAFGQAGDAGADAGGGELVAPVLIGAPEPEYPAGETRAASVLLELTLDASGAVTASDVVESDGATFDDAARAFAMRLHFSPALRNGVAIPARIPFRVDFAAPPPPAPAPLAEPEAPPRPAPAPPLPLAEAELVVRGAPPVREPTRRELDTNEVRTIPGTNGDVLKAVETMPGVARAGALDGVLIVRGSAPDDTQVFVDGTPIPFAYHFGGFDSVVPGDLLERLDFYPGNFGPQFGRATGGIVDVGLRAPRRDRLHALAQVDLLDARALVETPLGDDTRALLAVRRSWLDAWIGSALSGDDTSVRTAPVYWDGQAMVEHDLSERTRLRVSLFGADDRFAIVVKSPDASAPGSGGYTGGAVRFLRAQLRLDTELSERVHWSNTLAWGLTDSRIRAGNNPFDLSVNELDARSELRTRLAREVSLTTGLDAGYARYDVDATFRPYDADNASPSPYFARPARDLTATAALVRPAAYAGIELTPWPALQLMPSVRADYASDTNQVTLDPRFATRLELVHEPRRTTLKAGAGVFHQPPQVEQSVDPVGTEGIESSRALHTSLGIEQEIAQDFDVSLEGFYKRLSNLVVARADETRLIGARFENTGDGHVYGAELLVRYRPLHGRLSGWLAYTLSRSERRDLPSGDYYTFAWDQTHILSAVANLGLGRGWTLGARFRYISGTPFTPYAGGAVDLDAGAYAALSGNALNSARLGAFHQLDLRIEKLWQFEAWKLTAYLELRNVYNRENPESAAYNYDYSQVKPVAGLPLLPIAGVRGEL